MRGCLAKSIEEASFGKFRCQLEYKAPWYGKQAVVADRFLPSIRLCSWCGTRFSGVKDLSARRWKGPSCGAVHDRDTNAAVNNLHEGIRSFA